MGRKQSKKIDLEAQGGGLTHNPFAALRAGGAAPTEEPQSESPAATPAGGTADEATAARVEVRFEKKGRGGKAVTVARWMDGVPEAGPGLADIAREVAKAMGAGCSVEGDALVLQGRQVDRLADLLERRHGARTIRGAT